MRSSLAVTFGAEEFDRYRALTFLTLAGIAGALALRVFGLPQVDLHAPLHYLGLMDPLCGMTRAVRALALGNIGSALKYNPASLALALGAALVVTRTASGLVTHQWISVAVSRRPLWILVVVGLLALWVNQQLGADLLLRTA